MITLQSWWVVLFYLRIKYVVNLKTFVSMSIIELNAIRTLSLSHFQSVFCISCSIHITIIQSTSINKWVSVSLYLLCLSLTSSLCMYIFMPKPTQIDKLAHTQALFMGELLSERMRAYMRVFVRFLCLINVYYCLHVI